MDVVPIPDVGTNKYRWTYLLAGSPVSAPILRATFMATCPVDQPERLLALRMGSLDVHLRNAAEQEYGYYWNLALDMCSTPDPRVDPDTLVMQLQIVAASIPEFAKWKSIKLPPSDRETGP